MMVKPMIRYTIKDFSLPKLPNNGYQWLGVVVIQMIMSTFTISNVNVKTRISYSLKHYIQHNYSCRNADVRLTHYKSIPVVLQKRFHHCSITLANTTV